MVTDSRVEVIVVIVVIVIIVIIIIVVIIIMVIMVAAAVCIQAMPYPALPQHCRCTIARLRCHGVPLILQQLVAWCFLAGLVEGLPLIDGVEFFAGNCAVSRSLRAAGHDVVSFEILFDSTTQDVKSKLTVKLIKKQNLKTF